MPNLRAVSLDELRQDLGEPSLERREENARLLQYNNKHCSLLLYFYQTNGHFEVRHIEARDPIYRSRINLAECYWSLKDSVGT